MYIPRTTLTRHHMQSGPQLWFLSGLFPMQFLMRFSCRQNHSTSSDIQGVELVHTVCSQLLCVCGYCCHLTLNCSFALRLELSVSFLLELRLLHSNFCFGTSLVELFGPCKNWRTAPFCLVPAAVLNDDDGGLSVASWSLLFSKPFPWFRVKMLTHFEDFLAL